MVSSQQTLIKYRSNLLCDPIELDNRNLIELSIKVIKRANNVNFLADKIDYQISFSLHVQKIVLKVSIDTELIIKSQVSCVKVLT